MANTLSGRQTFLAKTPADVQKKWYIVDATDIPLGRLSADVAQVLMGKHRPEYTPHVNTGEYVIIVNAEKIGLTGRKADHRLKMRYSSHPGGLKAETYGQVRDKKPALLIEDAVRRMLPKNRLARVMMKNMYVFAGPEHDLKGKNPQKLVVG